MDITEIRAAAALAAATFLAGRRCEEKVVEETVRWFARYIDVGKTKKEPDRG